jgi:hypothetical protein
MPTGRQRLDTPTDAQAAIKDIRVRRPHSDDPDDGCPRAIRKTHQELERAAPEQYQGLPVVAGTSDWTVQGAVLPHSGLRPNQLAATGDRPAIFGIAAGGAFGIERIWH